MRNKTVGVKRSGTNKKEWVADYFFRRKDGSKAHLYRSGFFSAAEASAWIDEQVSDLEDKSGRADRQTFDYLVKEYEEYLKTKMKPTSAYEVKLIIDRKIARFFGDRNLGDAFSPAMLVAYRNDLSEDGNTEEYHNRIIAITKRISEFAFNRDIISTKSYKNANVYLDPFHGAARPRPEAHIWTKEQYAKFIATFEPNDKYIVLFKWLFFSGCRIGEALALQVRDFDEREKTISITKTASNKCGTGRVEIGTPKTKASYRTIELSDEMCGLFVKLIHDFGMTDKDFIFFGKERPMGVTEVRRRFNVHTKAAHLPHIKIHEIRHSNNTWLINDHHSPSEIEAITKRLGRSSVKVTLDTYYHSVGDVQKTLINNLKI